MFYHPKDQGCKLKVFYLSLESLIFGCLLHKSFSVEKKAVVVLSVVLSAVAYEIQASTVYWVAIFAVLTQKYTQLMFCLFIQSETGSRLS